MRVQFTRARALFVAAEPTVLLKFLTSKENLMDRILPNNKACFTKVNVIQLLEYPILLSRKRCHVFRTERWVLQVVGIEVRSG